MSEFDDLEEIFPRNNPANRPPLLLVLAPPPPAFLLLLLPRMLPPLTASMTALRLACNDSQRGEGGGGVRKDGYEKGWD